MSEPSDDFLDDAVSQLAQAWLKRSPAERSAFAERLAAVSVPDEQPDSTLRTVRERAALCGAVAPSDLVSDLDRDEADRALDLLAPEFDRVHAAGRWTWTLRTAPRRAALSALAANGCLPDRLAEVTGIRTDQAGVLLRLLAQRRSTSHGAEDGRDGSAGENDPATVVQALTWARPLGGFDGALAEAQRRAAVRSLSEGYGVLTKHGVFGRERELAQLEEFAAGLLETDGSSTNLVPVLSLTGIGGTGKSTVLGTFIRPYLDQIEAGTDPAVPVVVVLDFDRVHFRPTAELELSFELTRQLGYAMPVAAADFSALRYQVTGERRQSGSDRHVSYVLSESLIREVSAFERHAGELVKLHQLEDRPVLLVLDTFEEWQRERPHPDKARTLGNAPEERILDWISRVRSVMKLQNLRVIISGRVRLGETGGLLGSRNHSHLVVGDLDPAASGELLGALGITASDATAIAALVGGNPLTLHIAARFYQGLDPAARREFLAGDPLSAEGLTADIRAAVLYQRFLGHIPEPRVRMLAHPGLLLRRITPELVGSVLAGPCGLGEITADEAEDLTRRLADEVWLVQQTPNGLYHRRDVRGPMIKLMAKDPKHAGVVEQIHAAAVRWYETGGHGRDQLPADQAGVEALYHSLMLRSGDEPVAPEPAPERERWLYLAQELGQSVDELPEKVAAQVRVLRGEEIHDGDAEALPDPVWRLWIEQRGRALVDNGEPVAALDLLATRPSPVLPEWLAQAYSDVGQWDRYYPAVRMLSGQVQVNPLASSTRYAMLNAVLPKDDDGLTAYRTALADYLSGWPGEVDTCTPDQAERLFCRLLYDLGLPPGQAEAAPTRTVHVPMPTEGDHGRVDLFPVDQLRRMMAWIAAPPQDEETEFFIENVASFCRPDPRWMRDFAAFAGIHDTSGLDAYLARLSRALSEETAGLSTQELLGAWAIGYEKTLGSPRIGLRWSQVREAANLIHVLRGDNPELRPSIQLALAELAAGPRIGELASIAGQLVPVVAADLRPAALADGSGSDRRTLIQLVEYVDRSGVMREFLAGARRAWPQAALLQRVTEAFTTWDDANSRLLDRLADWLRDGGG